MRHLLAYIDGEKTDQFTSAEAGAFGPLVSLNVLYLVFVWRSGWCSGLTAVEGESFAAESILRAPT